MCEEYSLSDIWDMAINYFDEDARQKSWYVIVSFLGKNHTDAWINKDKPLPRYELEKCLNLLDKLKYKIPLHRIMKKRFFWKDEFFVSPYTLEPRPETEAIIEISMNYKSETVFKPKTILDIGTGTGCILLSLLKEHKDAYGIGVDISTFVLDTAKQNAENLKISNCDFVLQRFGESEEVSMNSISDNYIDGSNHYFAAYENNVLAGRTFDLIVSNPPYVNTEIDYATKFDPIVAVFHDEPTRITNKLPLAENGVFLCEVPKYLMQSYEECFKTHYKWHKSGHPEILIFEYSNFG
ncbi:methyltransferase domain-containing protein [Candidatus Cytomitobacter primus]|uniref:Methyltransferase domain-containing protein n=1 Tax=Candidatus Cytomitobacter primus TaxID=2066024 RepID=A0A5C0UG43_9PROT|nr:methyltransferase domain-containing protein [Candidatus Cytomitobacter primus]QEK38697.1 methyltransferase domain-containing protein [Candidatus Cytomitobacter primus]